MADIPLKTIHLNATGNSGAGPIPVAPVVPAISTTPTGKVPPVAAAPAATPANTTATQAIKVRTIGMRPVLNPNAPSASASPTIKLGGPSAPVSASPTIKLGAPVSAAAPTIKLGGPSAPAAAPTIKLGGGASAAPTIKLGGAAGGAASGSPTIKLKGASAPTGIKLNAPVPAQMNEEEDTEKEEAAAEAEENTTTTGADVAFLIVRIVAFLIISWMIFVMGAQFANMYNDGNVNVPGMTRLSASGK